MTIPRSLAAGERPTVDCQRPTLAGAWWFFLSRGYRPSNSARRGYEYFRRFGGPAM